MKKLIITIFFFGCQPAMDHQPRLNAYAHSTFFSDENANRLPLADTYTYHSSGSETYNINRAFLERGRERFEIFCSVCHGILGDGQGIVTTRGFSPPPSYHTDALRKKEPRYFYEVITNGKGRMTRLGDRITPRDRWAIIAYIGALQLSQNISSKNLSPKEKNLLEKMK